MKKSLFPAYTEHVSILKRSVMHISVIKLAQIPLRGATQVSDVRWGLETTSIQFCHAESIMTDSDIDFNPFQSVLQNLVEWFTG